MQDEEKEEFAPSQVTSIDAAKPPETAEAAASSPTVPAPDPKFDEAVAYVESRGYSHGAAIEIVNKEGIEKILVGKAHEGDPGAPSHPGAVTNEAATPPAPSNEVAKQEGPPELGMKRCSTCKTWYPGGYEVCPHDGTRLQ